MSEKKKYSAYNGLARVPMVWGVPLMALLAVAAPIVMLTLALAFMFGPGGLLTILLLAPIIGFLKKICETDDQALRILWLELQCRVQFLLGAKFGKTFTLAPVKLGRRLSVYRQQFRKDK